jgi:hypothetical protein
VGDLATWVLVAVAVVLVAAWYLSFTASRLDRLHHRVESSRAALDAQLARRAGLAVELALRVGEPHGAALAAAASAVLRPAGDRPGPPIEHGVTSWSSHEHGVTSRSLATGVPAGRGSGPSTGAIDLAEVAQSSLTRALAAALADAGDVDRLRRRAHPDDVEPLLAQLTEAAARSQMARRFHNDAVAQTQRVRRKWVVRAARLAGHAEMPRMVEIDDRLPPALGDASSRVP